MKDGSQDDALVCALNPRMTGLQKRIIDRPPKIERRDGEQRCEIKANDYGVEGLCARSDASLGAERRVDDALQRVFGVGLRRRLAELNGLLGDGWSNGQP